MTADGERRQRRKGGFATKREAQAFLAEQQTRLGDGSYAAPSKLTLGEFLTDEWLPAVEGDAAPADAHRLPLRAVAAYDRAPDRRRAPAGALRRPSERALPRARAGRALGLDPPRRPHACFTALYEMRSRWGSSVRNPATLADPPALERSRANAWTAGELRRFLDHVGDDRLLRAVAAGSDHRDATRRARGAHLARSRPRRRAAVGRAAARPRARRAQLRTAEVGPLAADDRARPRDGRRASRGTARRSCSNATSPPTPTRTATSCSAMRSAARSTRAAHRISASTARPPGSRPGRCTRFAPYGRDAGADGRRPGPHRRGSAR